MYSQGPVQNFPNIRVLIYLKKKVAESQLKNSKLLKSICIGTAINSKHNQLLWKQKSISNEEKSKFIQSPAIADSS